VKVSLGSKGDEITLSPASPAVGQQTDIAPAVQISRIPGQKRAVDFAGIFRCKIQVQNSDDKKCQCKRNSLLTGATGHGEYRALPEGWERRPLAVRSLLRAPAERLGLPIWVV
jgi:hypothetical protein